MRPEVTRLVPRENREGDIVRWPHRVCAWCGYKEPEHERGRYRWPEWGNILMCSWECRRKYEYSVSDSREDSLI